MTHGLTCGFPGGSVVKNPPANAGVLSSIPGLGRSPGGGNGNTLQCGQRSLQGSTGSQRVRHNLTLEHRCMGLVALWHVGSSQIRD